ncbi:TonB-dependent receptor [Oceaniserpentilla sp. 4NH20-0058]|uniref:TonB-dependent receptor n=1 Tax=Oceaniserpentilla sp. 4NH20-0058 TaxID=3127660 RepID=UPI003341B1F9
MNLFLFFIVCISSGLSVNVVADTIENDAALDTIQVEGQTDQGFSVHSIIGSHQSIDVEASNQNFKTLPDLLEQQSGIEIQSIGGIGQYASPVIRGSSGKQVLVFWDGLLVNGISGSSADIGSLGLSYANSIDIYRSLAPIELSASSVGGVIQIKSQDLSSSYQDNNGAFSLTAGSYGTRKISVRQALNLESSNWLLAGELTQADNDFKYLEERPVSNPNKPAYESRHNNGAQQSNVLLKGQHQFQSHEFNIAIQSNQSNREISAKINTPTTQTDIASTSHHLQTSWNIPWSNQIRSEVITSAQHQIELFDDRYSSVGLGSQLNEYESQAYKLQTNQYFDFDSINSVITLRVQTDKTQADYQLLTEDEVAAQCLAGRGCKSPYRRTQADLGSRLSYRINQFEYSLQGALLEIRNQNLTPNENSTTMHHSTWSLGVSRYYSDGVTLFYSISNQLRVPSTTELFGDRGLSKGNDELTPEKALSHDIGLRFQTSNVEYASSLYFRDVADAIHAETDSSGVIRYDNLGKTQHLGWEHTMSYQPKRELSLNANVTLQSNEIIKDDRFSIYEGKQVAGYSQIYSFLQMQYFMNHWDMSIAHTFEDGGYYRNSNTRKKDTKDQWNISIGKNINNWRITLDLVDITNSAARDYIEYPEPGRQIYLKTQTKW